MSAIFAAHLDVAERLLTEAVTRLAAARQTYIVCGMDDAATLAAAVREAEALAWSAMDDIYNAACVAEKVRCDREDARYSAFRRRAA